MTETQTIVVTPRPKYDRLIKLMISLTALLVSISLASILIYVAPALSKLVDQTATEKEQDACYDQYTADVTDGNAATLAALTIGQAAIGDLVNALAAQPRDPAVVDDAVDKVALSARGAIASSQAYNEAIAARKQYVIDGLPLPCTNTPN